MAKYLLAYHEPSKKTSLSYLSRLRLTRYLTSSGNIVTYDPADEYDVVIYPSGYDMFMLSPKVREEKKSIVLAFQDDRDYTLDQDDEVVLSQVSHNLYKKADVAWVRNKEDIANLAKLGQPHAEVRDLGLTYPTRLTLSSEKEAFRRFYRIPKEHPAILALADFLTEQDRKNILTLAKISPKTYLLCAGLKNNDEYVNNLEARVRGEENADFETTLPEELYHSALESLDGFLLLTHASHNIVLYEDLLAHHVPIYCLGTKDRESIPELSQAIPAENLPSLYRLLESRYHSRAS